MSPVSGGAFAASPAAVTATLWDKRPDWAQPDEAHPIKFGSTGDMTMATLGVKIDMQSVQAGAMTFQVTNASMDIVHEMILSPLPTNGAA